MQGQYRFAGLKKPLVTPRPQGWGDTLRLMRGCNVVVLEPEPRFRARPEDTRYDYFDDDR